MMMEMIEVAGMDLMTELLQRGLSGMAWSLGVFSARYIQVSRDVILGFETYRKG